MTKPESATNQQLDVLIKVGGSLLGWPELSQCLLGFLDRDPELNKTHSRHCAMVAGGGAAADVIRSIDRVHGLGSERAHDLAIRAMELTAAILQAIVQGSVMVGSDSELAAALVQRKLPIIAPREFLKKIDDCHGDPLPASWDVTSDSIAARIACHVGAKRLILLKSASTDAFETIKEAARGGLVDPYLQFVVEPLERVDVVCLRDPLARIQRLRHRSTGLPGT